MECILSLWIIQQHQSLTLSFKWLKFIWTYILPKAKIGDVAISVPSVAKERAGQMPPIMPWPSETFSLNLHNTGHTPSRDCVAAQSLGILGNQRCLHCASLPLAGITCRHPNTELTVSTNQENKWKKRGKRKLTIVILLSKNFLLQLDSTLKSAKSRSYSQVSVLMFTIVWSVSDPCWPANSLIIIYIYFSTNYHYVK